MLEPRALSLDAHVDIFGHQTDKGARVISTQAKRNIDNPIVVGVVLIRVQERDFRIICDQLIRKNRQSTESVLVEVRTRYLDAFLNFLWRGAADNFIDELNRDAGFAADALVAAVLNVVQLLQHRHGNHDLVLCKSGDGSGVVQQHVGVQYVNLAMCSFELGYLMGLGCSQRHESSSRDRLEKRRSARSVIERAST